MPMMQVWKMGMCVHQRLLLMGVVMRFFAVPWKVMCVLMMDIMVMHVGMRMWHRQMGMLVRMPFRHVQPDANPHQRRTHPKYVTGNFTKNE